MKTNERTWTRLTHGAVIVLALSLLLSACGGDEETDVALKRGATPNPVPAPGGVSASAGDGQVIVRWNAVADATGYNLFWATAPNVSKTTGTKVSGVASPFIHAGLTNGTTYYYIVTALRAEAESAASAPVSATPAAGLNAQPVPAPGGVSVVDQEQPVIDTAAGFVYAIGGSSEQKLAQVVTPAMDGQLTEVRFPVGCAADLIVRIETVAGGLPADKVLEETVIPAAQVGPHSNPPAFKSLPLATPLPVTADRQFAIVLNSLGSCGLYPGPAGDPYAGGNAFYDSRPNAPGVWVALSGGRSDLPFQTVVFR